MNGIDYTKKLNRQNEVYQKNLRDQSRTHKEQVGNIQEQSQARIKSQSKSHLDDKHKMEKNHSATIDNLRTNQGSELHNKNKLYEQEVERNKNEFHDIRQKNLKEWRTKFTDLKNNFDENKKQTNLTNKATTDEITKNYKENLSNIQKKSREDLDRYVATTESSSDDTAEVQKKQFRKLESQYKDEKNGMIQKNLRQKQVVEGNALKDINEMREAQKNEFIKGRDFNKLRFEELNKDLNVKREQFERERIQTVQNSNIKENRNRNEEFADRFSERSKQYEKDLRKIDIKYKAQKVSDHGISDQIQAEQRVKEKEQFKTQKESIIEDKLKTTKQYEEMMGDLTKSYQDSFQDIRLEFAEKAAKTNRDITEQNRQSKERDKIKTQKIVNDSTIALKYVEDRSDDRLRSQSDASKTQIINLKEDFNKGMQLATIKARKDFEKNREETVKEKAILQKRLHEQNSKNNTFVRKTFNEKISKMQTGYEKRIMELENQNKLLQENAHDALKSLNQQSMAEIERQREIAQQSAKEEIAAERQSAVEKERKLRTTLNKLQADYSKRMNELSNNNSRKMRNTTLSLQLEKSKQAQKYEDTIDQNKKFFEREMARLTSSSQAERDALITQYEDRIKSLSKLHNQKIKEMQEFDRLNSKNA